MKRSLIALTLMMSIIIQPLGGVVFAQEADETERIPCIFSEDYEDYSPHYGGELYSKSWDTVLQDGDRGGKITVEQDGDRFFAAYYVKARVEDKEIASPVVATKKNGINNKDKTLVYDACLYMFDDNAKVSLAFTNSQGTAECELMTIRGGEAGLRDSTNEIKIVRTDIPKREWNRVAAVYNDAAKTVDLYVNGEKIASHGGIKTEGINMENTSFKIEVKNNTRESYSEGRIYMDDMYVYEAEAPVANIGTLITNKEIDTYLNKQFTGISNDGKAHGISSFYSSVSIVDTPEKTNKSALIKIGRDGIYFPLEKKLTGDFMLKANYKSGTALKLTAKTAAGKVLPITELPAHRDLSAHELRLAAEEELAYIGIEGDGAEITLNKLFVYSGHEPQPDSYFVDYAYQKKAAMVLVTDGWKSAYTTMAKGVFMGIDFYQASLFGEHMRFSSQPPRMINGEAYVPAAESIAFLGGEVLQTENGISFKHEGKELKIEESELAEQRHMKYVSAKRLAELMGMVLSWDGEYLIAFGKTSLFAGNADTSQLKSALYYQRPTGAEIVDRIEKKGCIHPRVYADSERIAEVKANVENNGTMAGWYNTLMNDAEKYLNDYTLYYTKPDGTRLLSVSNLMVSRMSALGMAYKFTGDTKYAKAAWRDLEAVSKFKEP